MDAQALEEIRNDIAVHQEFVMPRSAAYGRTLELLSEALDGPLAKRLDEAWREREFGPFYERPLLLLTSLRDDALREGEGHPLWRGIGTHDPDTEAITADALSAATADDREHFWRSMETRYIQTNETSRAIAWLWPASIIAAADPGRGLEVIDFGASAGLNLVADRLPWIWDREDGRALEPTELPQITGRTGIDLRPLNLLDPDDVRWLRALLWPGQRERSERFEAALAAYRELAEAGEVSPIEAASVDEATAAMAPRTGDDSRALGFQTVMHDYLPDDVRARFDAAKRDWLAASEPSAALWSELEITEGGDHSENAMAITIRMASGGDSESHLIARCGPHPRLLEIDDDAVTAFREALARAG